MGRDYLILADRHAADIEAALRRFAVEGRDPGLARIRCLPCSSPGLKEHIALSDIVVAWEDSLDELSLGWRPLGRIAALCREMNKPLDVVCGSCSVEAKMLRKSGITNIFPLEGICGNAFPEGDELLVAGCDEAGRGCLAGPVFAAAVILPEGFYHPLLNDSKQLSAAQRNMLRSSIESSALAWKVVAVDAQEIDRINILNASIEGMRRALAALGRRPHCILVDGNRFKPCCDATGRVIPHHCIVHGDARCAAISAASVLAKTHRDEYMVRLAEKFPQYGWDRNFAYPTAEHKAAIKEFGITPYHRKSYKLD